MLNQDAIPRPGWLAAMRAALSDPTLGVAGGKLLYPDGKTVQHAGGIVLWPRAIPDHWGHREPDDGRWNATREVDYVTGAAWGFRRETWSAVGELDEGFWPGYFEDTDYCLRVRREGWRIVYVPEAEAIHDVSSSLGEGSAGYLDAFHRGRLRFVLKHLSLAQILADFVPAERQWLEREADGAERRTMAQAYRAAITSLPTLFAAHEKPPEAFIELAAALAKLGMRTVDDRGTENGGHGMHDDVVDLLEARRTVEERPFHSDKRFVGPLIAWFRTVWNNISTRWYVLPLLEQQNAFNDQVVAHLREMDQRLIALDRDQTALTRTVAELTYQLARLSRRLDAVEAAREEPEA
jgi:hypothetical protein